MESLEEYERKRERNLKARGLIEKTFEDEMNERRHRKKYVLYDKLSTKSVSFSENIDQMHHFSDGKKSPHASYRLPKLFAN
jgi:hypothetical protein